MFELFWNDEIRLFSQVSEMIFYMRFQSRKMFSMAISTHYIDRDCHDTNLKNSRFAEVNKHNEEYLGVLDI